MNLSEIKKVAGVDEGVGFLVYDVIDRHEEIFVHLFFSEIHPALGIEAVEGCEAQVGIGDVDEFYLYFYMEFYEI
jgi:hypothetical protein